jgi:hypothetical protein
MMFRDDDDEYLYFINRESSSNNDFIFGAIEIEDDDENVECEWVSKIACPGPTTCTYLTSSAIASGDEIYTSLSYLIGSNYSWLFFILDEEDGDQVDKIYTQSSVAD